MKKYWNYNHAPTKPTRRTSIDTDYKSKNEVLKSFGAYENVSFEQLNEIKKAYTPEKDAKDLQFAVCIEDVGTSGDIEYQLQVQALFVLPTNESEKKEIAKRNEQFEKEYQSALSLYKLKMTDYQEIVKENDDKAKEHRRQQFINLKKEFEG